MTNLPINRIINHCTATREGVPVSVAQIRAWHTTPVAKGGRGWKDIGYHYVIMLDGKVGVGRPETQIGAHCEGFNRQSLGIVYVGGLNGRGEPADTRTVAQKKAQARLNRELAKRFGVPSERIVGHRDLDYLDKNHDGVAEAGEFLKECPCFDVAKERDGWLKGA